MSDLAINYDLAIDDPLYGDLLIVNGDLVLMTDPLQIIYQTLQQNLKLFLGESFVDKSAGVPYIQAIIEKNPNPVIVQTAYVSVILNTPGVKALTYFTMSIDRVLRQLLVEFQVETDFGLINFQQVV